MSVVVVVVATAEVGAGPEVVAATAEVDDAAVLAAVALEGHEV